MAMSKEISKRNVLPTRVFGFLCRTALRVFQLQFKTMKTRCWCLTFPNLAGHYQFLLQIPPELDTMNNDYLNSSFVLF